MLDYSSNKKDHNDAEMQHVEKIRGIQKTSKHTKPGMVTRRM